MEVAEAEGAEVVDSLEVVECRGVVECPEVQQEEPEVVAGQKQLVFHEEINK